MCIKYFKTALLIDMNDFDLTCRVMLTRERINYACEPLGNTNI